MATNGRQINLGQKASRTLTFTAKDVASYAEITGDRNPLHFDEDFAARTKFGRLVVHGGLTADILNAIVAEDLPGPGTVFMSQDLKYVAPVYIGDTIVGEVEVLEVHPTKPVTKLKASVHRQDGDLVLEGVCWCYTLGSRSRPGNPVSTTLWPLTLGALKHCAPERGEARTRRAPAGGRAGLKKTFRFGPGR